MNIIIALQVSILAPTIPGYLYNNYQIIKNKFSTDERKKAGILISYPSFLYETVGQASHLWVGLKGQFAKFFTQNGSRCYFKHNATSHDLEELINDSDFQSIVLVGHGSRTTWVATDRKIYTSDIEKWSKTVPKKRGYFIQATCGDNDNATPLGYPILEDPKKCLGYNSEIDALHLFRAMESMKSL